MKRLLKVMTATVLSVSMLVATLPVVSLAEGEGTDLPAGTLLHNEDTTEMTAFTPSSKVTGSTYFLNGDVSYSGSVKYDTTSCTLYGKGYTFTQSNASGGLLGCNTNTQVSFYDMIFDGNSVVSSAAPFNVDVKASTWTFDNCVIQNYDAGENALIRLGASNASTLNLSNFKIDNTNTASSSIIISGPNKGTLNLGANVTIPSVYLSAESSPAITLSADFTGTVGFSADKSYINRDMSNLKNPVATVTEGADITNVTCTIEECSIVEDNGKLYIFTEAEEEPEPEPDADLYAVYTLDGTVDGEISRVKLMSSYSGTTISVPNTAFAARKFTDTNGLYDIYKCVSADKSSVDLEEGDNIVYITVEHAGGKYYYWEDFEGYELGSASGTAWNHGGANTQSDFITCTTDTVNTTTAARWFSNGTGGSRPKTFSIFSGTPVVPAGEKLVFSADLRVGVTNGNTTKLSFGNSADQFLLMLIKTNMNTTVNTDNTITLPSVTGSNDESSGKKMSKWFNLKIEIDPAASENNTTVTLTPLTEGDQVTANGEAQNSYSYTTNASVQAVTQMGVELCKGYFGAVIADNIMLYNTQTEYLTPAQNELQKAVQIYGDIDKSRYTDTNMPDYETAAAEAISVMNDSEATNAQVVAAKENLVKAASALELKSESNDIADDDIPEKGYSYDGTEVTCYEDGDVIIADYSGTALTEVRTVNAEKGDKITVENISGRKIMFWNSLDGMEPFDKTITLPANKEPVTASTRTVVNEDAGWIFIKEYEYQSDSEEIISSAPEKLSLSGWTGTDVPHTWNAYDGSDGIQGYDRCKGWYRKSIYISPEYEGKRIYLEFEGAALKASLYVNGTAVPFTKGDPYNMGEETTYIHRGGYETFRYDITDYVTYDGANTVAVCVDNTVTIETIPLGGDYSRQGGMYRDVSLVVTEPVHIDMTDHGSRGLYLLPKKKTAVTDNTNEDFTLTASAKIVNDSDAAQNIKIEAELREPDHFDVPDNEYIKKYLRFNPEDMYTAGGRTVGTFEVKQTELAAGASYDYSDTINVTSPKLWDGMESPYSYEVVLNVYRDDVLCDTITDNVGFRYFYAPNPTSVADNGGFYLNGRKYDLRGVGKHQDRGRKEDALGVAVTDKERLEDAATMYEMGINTVRLVHYPHSVREIEIYDRLGIVVWSELAMTSVICNADAQGYPSFEATSLEQLESLIKQQYNNPSVFFWAFSNEITHEFDDNLKLISSQEKVFSSAPALFDKMQAKTKALDSERLTTYAANTIRHTPDLNTDLLAMNTYPYWYNTRSSDNPKSNLKNYFDLEWADSEKTTKKPIAFGEIGGAGIAGDTQEYNADGTVTFLGTKFASATYQTYMHEKILQGIETGTPAVWGVYLWQMFDSANDTTDAVFPGMNIKGLVSYDHKTRKDAYYFYKANWNKWEPFAYVVNASVTERPDTETIIRAYSNMDKCQLYANGEPYGEPITDTNTNDKVVDGYHVFMWYGVPLGSGGNTIEVRGIKDGSEKCTSVDTNGEIVFTSSFDATSLKLTDTTKLNLNGDKIELQCMAKDAPAVSEIASITGVLSGSTVSVVMPDGTAVTDGRLCEGMRIRVTGGGEHKDYAVIADDIAQDATITASDSSNASVLNDGNTAAAWNGSAGSSLVIDLGSEYKLNGLDMYFDTASPYTVQVSSNGTSYTDALSVAAASDTITSDKLDLTGRYVKITLTSAVSVSEINVYGWRFTVSGGHIVDESAKTITVNQSGGEVDTTQLENDIKIDGEAAYGFELQEATRVLSDGDKLVVTEKFGAAKEYILKLGS